MPRRPSVRHSGPLTMLGRFVCATETNLRVQAVSLAAFGASVPVTSLEEINNEQIIEIVLAEVEGREAAAAEYSALGHAKDAARLRSEAEVLLSLLPERS